MNLKGLLDQRRDEVGSTLDAIYRSSVKARVLLRFRPQFKCSFCDKISVSVITQNSLLAHERDHTGERPEALHLRHMRKGVQVGQRPDHPQKTCPQDLDSQDEAHCEETQESQEAEGARRKLVIDKLHEKAISIVIIT